MATVIQCDGCDTPESNANPIHDMKLTVEAAVLLKPGSIPRTITLEGQFCNACGNTITKMFPSGRSPLGD